MVYVIFAYFFTSLIVLLVIQIKNRKFEPIKNVKLKKYGLVFLSKNRHRIKIDDAKVLKIENNVYLKKNNRTVVIKNIERVVENKNYLYFTGLGQVKIVINCKKFYKYFCVDVTSEDFDINELKQRAIDDIIQHIFDLNECVELIRFLKIMRDVLKINLENNCVKVEKNKYNFSYILTYIVNGKKKFVRVE